MSLTTQYPKIIGAGSLPMLGAKKYKMIKKEVAKKAVKKAVKKVVKKAVKKK